MKNWKLGFVLPALLICLPVFTQIRKEIPLTENWRFYKGEVRSVNPDVSTWEPVTIPHCWNATDGQSPVKNGYYRGPGVYARSLDIVAEMKDKRLFLRFEAVSSAADVYLNGKLLGRHEGAFNAFCFEITGKVKTGENRLLVKATNEWNKNIAPLAGDFNIFGGIYRPVSLWVLNPVSLTPLDHASSGVYIKQTEVRDDYAKMNVLAKITNGSDKQTTGRVVTTLFDRNNRVVTSAEKDIVLAKKEVSEARLEMEVNHPVLWNGIENPYLYRCLTEVYVDDMLTDSLSHFIGLRYFSIDPERGFILNGKPNKIRGVNRHQDRLGKGWGISKADHEEDMALIREMGANGIRLAHYPHSDYFYSLCDRYGLLVWAEIPLIERVTDNPEFRENAKLQMRELIRQNFNHPSIFCWGLFNEVNHPEDAGDPFPIMQELNDLVHAEDPTRFTVAAPNVEKRPENYVPDHLAYNTYPGWYWAEPETMGGSVNHWNNLNDKKGIAVSEYGAGASIYHHEQGMTKAPDAGGKWHPEEWQGIVHEGNYKHIKSRDFVWGSFIWNMFDFCIAGRTEGDTDGMNDKGLVTYDRKVKKDAFYYYKANWSHEPVLYITSRRHTEREDPVTDVKVYSNCRGPVLTVNGQSYGSVQGENGVFVWKEIPLQEGNNTIEVKARSNEELISDQCIWKLK